jgi:hypothetical protein
MGVGGIGYASAVPTPIVTNAKTRRLRRIPSREELARALVAVGCGALSFLDKLLDFLATFLSNALVEVWAIAITCGFAALLSTLLTDLLVKFVAVGQFRC